MGQRFNESPSKVILFCLRLRLAMAGNSYKHLKLRNWGRGVQRVREGGGGVNVNTGMLDPDVPLHTKQQRSLLICRCVT